MEDEIKETPFEDLISIKVLQKMLRLENRIKELEQINEEHRKLNGMLREENKRLKEENKRIFANVNDDQLLRSNAMNYAEAQDYKTRNEKAIEYMKYNATSNYFDNKKNMFRREIDLLDILQNGEENE